MLFWLALGICEWVSRAALAAPETVRVLLVGAPREVDPMKPALRGLWSNQVEVESDLAWRARHQIGVDPAALSPLSEADQLLTAARRSAAELDEPAALRHLAQAERLLAGALAVPGAAAFYAEVQLQLGVTAAQLGLIGLAEAAFARAARLDGRRRLLAGEAAPEVVALAARAFDEASSAPQGEVLIVTDMPGAHVFIDDVERGVTPLTVRASVGVHALRLAAQGRAGYGVLFEMEQGRRPPQRFVLTLDACAAAVGGLSGLPADANAEELTRVAQRVLKLAPELTAVAWVVRDELLARGLLFVCDRQQCHNPLRHERGSPRHLDSAHGRLSQLTLEAARDWLHAGPEPNARAQPTVVPLWQRWYVWSALGAVLVGAGASVAFAAQPEPQRTLRVSVDPGALR